MCHQMATMGRLWSFAHEPCYLNQRYGVQGIHDILCDEINEKLGSISDDNCGTCIYK